MSLVPYVTSSVLRSVPYFWLVTYWQMTLSDLQGNGGRSAKTTVLIARSVSVFFRRVNIFARESAMMKRYFYAPSSSSVIKSKMAATPIRTWTSSFRPSKMRLHGRQRFLEQALPLSLPFALYLFPFPILFAPTTQAKGIYALKTFAAGNIARKTPFEAGWAVFWSLCGKIEPKLPSQAQPCFIFLKLNTVEPRCNRLI